MRLDDLQYDLPPELIAQQPADRRDESRLLVIDRRSGGRRHLAFRDLPDLIPPGALLVMNNTRVLPARVLMHRETGGRIEGLFLDEREPGQWRMMLTGAGRFKPGELVTADTADQQFRMLERLEPSTWLVEPVPAGDVSTILSACGRPPLPPYISRKNAAAEQAAADIDRYQTIYAQEPGAVAAPTAGLHFTPTIFEALKARDIHHTFVTLHVGVGTFLPIRCDDLTKHDMHSERYVCSETASATINAARKEDRPIIAVGTTSVRVLESNAGDDGTILAGSGETKLFIYPPYRFRAVDAMITNFHLPGSTLLAMIYAFAGKQVVLDAYHEAIAQRYRFFSYGDAMLMI